MSDLKRPNSQAKQPAPLAPVFQQSVGKQECHNGAVYTPNPDIILFESTPSALPALRLDIPPSPALQIFATYAKTAHSRVSADNPFGLNQDEFVVMLRSINSFTKDYIAYVTDTTGNTPEDAQKGRVPSLDYWQHPNLTALLQKGDCEDQAILARYYLVNVEGVNPEDIRLALCINADKRSHAVLLVKHPETRQEYVLDSESGIVLTTQDFERFKYQYKIAAVLGQPGSNEIKTLNRNPNAPEGPCQ